MDYFADLPSHWHWAIAVWLAALGGCVGSFLNVVVYRLPAGKSLIRPGSYCPKCGHPIRWYDNVPVLGWLWLRGKCRDCGEPIALRYPAVEALTATIFFGLAWVELFSGGANLPTLKGMGHLKSPCVFRSLTASELVGIYACHLLLLCTLLPAALIRYDKQRVPVRLFVPALLVGAAVPLIWPRLHPECVDIWQYRPAFGLAFGLAFELYRLLILAGVGLAIGWVIGWFVPRREKSEGRTRNPAADGILLASVCVSFFLTVEAVLLLGAAVLVLVLLERAARWLRPGLPRVGPVIWLAVLVPLWLIFWRQLAAMCPLVY